MALAKGWDRESEDLFIHETGARISKSTYRGKMAWWLFPVSLDVPALEYPPTDEGREQAFAGFLRDHPAKTKRKAASGKKKLAASPDEDGNRNRDGEGEEPDSGKEEGDEDAGNDDKE